jgi:integrase
MASNAGSLTALALKNAKPKAKPYRLADGGGMYLEVMPTGARYWRLKYRVAGKEKRLALGVYPDVSLADARIKRDEARNLLREQRDPSAERQIARRKRKLSSANTFGALADEWLSKQRTKLAPVTATKAQWLLGMAGPLSTRPIAEINAPEILGVLRTIEARGTHETAHRVKQRISQVFRYAVATGRAERDPTFDLRGALTPVTTASRAAITDPDAIAHLLRAIDGYAGQPVTHAALRLSPLVFARPGNIRAMEWSELDLDKAEWRIPAAKMKVREGHVVPLPKQAVDILRELHDLTGGGKYVFPGIRSAQRPMSENTVNAALRRLGFDKETMTGHGFRALASTRLNEMGWAPDVIERQLAHAERNKVRAAYNRAQYMAERRKMMTAWADYLDSLKAEPNKVIPIKRKAG